MTALLAAGVVVATGSLAGSAARSLHGRLARGRVVALADPAGAPGAAVGTATWWLGTTVGCVVLTAMVAGPGAAAAVLVAAAAFPAGLQVVRRDLAERRYVAALPAVLDDVAGEVRAGSSLVGALRAAAGRADAAVAADLASVCDTVALGGSLAGELDAWSARRPGGSVALVTAALAVASVGGGPSARALDGVAATLRERAEVEREAAALATQARASAVVMVATPVGFAVLSVVLDPRNGHLLLGTPLGLGCVVAGLTLDAAAALWMARILRAAP